MEINIFNIVLNNDAKPFSDSTTITNKKVVATIANVINTIWHILIILENKKVITRYKPLSTCRHTFAKVNKFA